METVDELTTKVDMAFGSSLKAILLVNDRYGSGAMREVVLDELNRLRRFILKEVTQSVEQRGDRAVSQGAVN